MRKWWKKIGVLAGGFLGLGGTLSTAHAQFGPLPAPAIRPVSSAVEPTPYIPPQFPEPGHAPSEPVSPFSLRDDGAPNAFTDLESAPAAPHPYHVALRLEYLHWWVSKVDIPAPLVTTSTAPDLITDFGALFQPHTVVLVGPGRRSYSDLNGGRVTFGVAPGFLPPMEISGWSFHRDLLIFNSTSDGSFLLARPVQLVNQPLITAVGTQAAYIAGAPGVGQGGISIDSHLSLWGFDLVLFAPFCDNGVVALDGIVGYKHAELNENFTISNFLQSNVGQFFDGQVIPPGFITNVVDNFASHNKFDGATLGLRTRLNWSRLTLITDGKLSLGSTHQTNSVIGFTTAGGLGGTSLLPGGILAQPSNGGIFTRHEFTAIPELNVSLSYQLFSFLRVFAGYDLLYWSSVGRPSGLIQTGVDPRQVPTDQNFDPTFRATRPTTFVNSTDFFAHGFHIGIEFCY
jgi:hypothetical protein